MAYANDDDDAEDIVENLGWVAVGAGIVANVPFIAMNKIRRYALKTSSSTMQEAIQDSEYMQQMHSMMTENRQHMQGMMGPMMNTIMDDPEMRQQMMETMSQHQAMMQSMMQNPEMMNMMMDQNMMGSGMMKGSGMGQMMIQDTELREQFNQQKLEHQEIMNDLMSADMSDPAVQQKIKDQIEKHQKLMDELMKQINTQTNR